MLLLKHYTFSTNHPFARTHTQTHTRTHMSCGVKSWASQSSSGWLTASWERDVSFCRETEPLLIFQVKSPQSPHPQRSCWSSCWNHRSIPVLGSLSHDAARRHAGPHLIHLLLQLCYVCSDQTQYRRINPTRKIRAKYRFGWNVIFIEKYVLLLYACI